MDALDFRNSGQRCSAARKEAALSGYSKDFSRLVDRSRGGGDGRGQFARRTRRKGTVNGGAQVFQLVPTDRRDTICHRGALWSRLYFTKIPRSGMFCPLSVPKGESDPRGTLLLGFAPIQFDLCIPARAGETGQLDNTEPKKKPRKCRPLFRGAGSGAPLWPGNGNKGRARLRAQGHPRLSPLEHLPIFVIYYRPSLVNSGLRSAC